MAEIAMSHTSQSTSRQHFRQGGLAQRKTVYAQYRPFIAQILLSFLLLRIRILGSLKIVVAE